MIAEGIIRYMEDLNRGKWGMMKAIVTTGHSKLRCFRLGWKWIDVMYEMNVVGRDDTTRGWVE